MSLVRSPFEVEKSVFWLKRTFSVKILFWLKLFFLFRSELALNRICDDKNKKPRKVENYNRFYNEENKSSSLEEYAMEERDRPKHVRRHGGFQRRFVKGYEAGIIGIGSLGEKLRRSLV